MKQISHGGDLIANTLIRHEVEFIFTLCGGHISPILVACKQKGIRVIDVRHEATAVFAADAVSRLSNTVGLASVTAGPGLTNSITAIKNAQLAQSPLILLGGATATILRGKGSLQDIDQMALLKPHVKWATSIRYLGEIVPKLEKGFYISQSDVPGPVFIEFPVDILYPENLVRKWYGSNGGKRLHGVKEIAQSVYMRWHVNRLFKDRVHKPQREIPRISYPIASINKVRKVNVFLGRSKKPVLLVGSQSMILTQEARRLQDAVRSLAFPTYLSGMARGLLGRNDPFYFKHRRKEALWESDLVILAGVPCDFRLNYGRHINRSATLVSINRNREDLEKNRKPNLALLSDPAITLQTLSQICDVPQDQWNDWIQLLSRREAERKNEINHLATSDAQLINPLYLCQQIEQHLDQNSIIVADGGDFVSTASYIIQPRGPLTWLDPGVFGTLGSGAGFALGAKLCHPDADVWIIYGDGSSGYSLAEWDTFVRHDIPVIAVVGNDAGWSQIAREQIDIFADDIGTTLRHTDYHQVAMGYGGEGLFLDQTRKISRTFQKARNLTKEGKPVLINALIDKSNFRKGSIAM